jgi:hypothetical protein
MQSYELCCDMIDVVFNISTIYGWKSEDKGPFDHESQFVIHPNNSTVLYLREVSHCLALVCILLEDSLEKQGLIDYNFVCLREGIHNVFDLKLTGGLTIPNFYIKKFSFLKHVPSLLKSTAFSFEFIGVFQYNRQ